MNFHLDLNLQCSPKSTICLTHHLYIYEPSGDQQRRLQITFLNVIGFVHTHTQMQVDNAITSDVIYPGDKWITAKRQDFKWDPYSSSYVLKDGVTPIDSNIE